MSTFERVFQDLSDLKANAAEVSEKLDRVADLVIALRDQSDTDVPVTTEQFEQLAQLVTEVKEAVQGGEDKVDAIA